MPHHIILGDLANFKADIIVNSAHPYPQAGTGVDVALYQKAGDALLEARKAFGILKTGALVKTPAFNLAAQHVYHVITPHVASEASSHVLRNLYQTIFKEALEDNTQSIALPLLASGNHGFDLKEALIIARDEIIAFLNHHEMDIYLIIYDKAQVVREVPVIEVYPIFENSYSLLAAEEISVKAKTFHEWLFHEIDQKGLTDPDVYKKANLTRQHFSKIRSNPKYQPTKSTVISLSLALRLNLDKMLDFLATAGYTLSPSILFDLIIEYHVKKRIYNIFEVNEVLFMYDQKTLG